MIKVWTDGAESGLLDRHGERGSTFAYLPNMPMAHAVSPPPGRSYLENGRCSAHRLPVSAKPHAPSCT